MAEKTLDVVAVGNAIVDVLCETDDSFLSAHGLPKGGMTLIDEGQAKALYAAMPAGVESSGGSAANTIAGIAALGGRAGFIGRVRNDQLGNIFRHDITAIGATYTTPAVSTGPATARCLILVSPDAERTMCTYLGASVQLDRTDLNPALVGQAKVLYLEGYLWDNPAARQAFLAAAEMARTAGTRVALSLSDGFCVDRHRESFLELVEQHIDLLFANEAEITSLYRVDDFESAVERLRDHCPLAVLTQGARGSVVLGPDGERHQVGCVSFGALRDTTGAGDLYAAGFLHGYTRGKSLDRCGQLGAIAAGEVVTHLGPRPQADLQALVARSI
ncbi:MAG: adenosine kinase [Aphanocapsa feldmannii 277cV]|uniref:Adenosine kinase n=2 Tax=Aphanocapsa feldmannii TaxID=192050 RepID=A0A524RN48_9CHRO|nr:MAG: adenosine kinase [Aphanocapsa feldmannii 277cV]TGH20706.1 MAG: adenosine kinase [Aphanocapsa feldmannii 277cI]